MPHLRGEMWQCMHTSAQYEHFRTSWLLLYVTNSLFFPPLIARFHISCSSQYLIAVFTVNYAKPAWVIQYFLGLRSISWLQCTCREVVCSQVMIWKIGNVKYYLSSLSILVTFLVRMTRKYMTTQTNVLKMSLCVFVLNVVAWLAGWFVSKHQVK